MWLYLFHEAAGRAGEGRQPSLFGANFAILRAFGRPNARTYRSPPHTAPLAPVRFLHHIIMTTAITAQAIDSGAVAQRTSDLIASKNRCTRATPAIWSSSLLRHQHIRCVR